MTAGAARADWRRVTVMFAVAAAFDISAWGQLQTFTPLFLRIELGLAPDEVTRWTGILAAATLAPALPLAPFWGALADRYGRKPVILRGYLVAAAGYLLSAVSPTPEALLLGRLLFGLGFGTNAVVAAAQADVTPDDRLASAISFVQMMFPLGMALGPLYGGFLVDVLGLRGLFLLNAALDTISFGLVFALFRDSAPRDRVPLRAKVGATFGHIARAREVRGVFLTIALLASGAALMDPFVPVYLDQLYRGNDPAAFIGVTMSLFGLLAGGLTPVAGRLADAVGRARLFGWSLAGLSAIALAMSFAPDALTLAGLQALRGVPQSGTIGLAYALIALYVAAERRGAVMSLVTLPRNAAGFLAPLVGAALAPFGVPIVFRAAAFAYLAAWLVIQLSGPAEKAG